MQLHVENIGRNLCWIVNDKSAFVRNLANFDDPIDLAHAGRDIT